jgi:hypothetical protein
MIKGCYPLVLQCIGLAPSPLTSLNFFAISCTLVLSSSILLYMDVVSTGVASASRYVSDTVLDIELENKSYKRNSYNDNL